MCHSDFVLFSMDPSPFPSVCPTWKTNIHYTCIITRLGSLVEYILWVISISDQFFRLVLYQSINAIYSFQIFPTISVSSFYVRYLTRICRQGYDILRRKLFFLFANKVLPIVWLPGHSCIKGNEMADQLAKYRSQRPSLWIRTYVECFYSSNKGRESFWKEISE